MEWTESLELGIPFIDSDHKVLVNLLNQVEDCFRQSEEITILGSVLASLVDYTKHHFAREEKLQALCGYKGLEGHAKTHAALTGEVEDFHSRFSDDPDCVGVEEVVAFLKTWLTKHILGHDFAFRDACLGNEAAIAEAASMHIGVSPVGGNGRIRSWRDLRIMVIDDNPNFRTLMRTVFRAIGVRNIQLVDNPMEGLARLSQRPTDIVFCDWVMDNMNGVEFTRSLREFNDRSKVVLLTGYSMEVMREKATNSGVDDFLEKPVSAHSLIQSVADVMA